MKRLILILTLLGLSLSPAWAETDDTSGSLWTHNAESQNGRDYLNGFVRGYIEGKQWGIEMMEGILPHAQLDASARIQKDQIESRLFLESLHYAQAVEGENLQKAIEQVTQWYQNPTNARISWIKLVDLAIGKVNGFHGNYVQYQLKWLQDVSLHPRIDWFHTIDPATGTGRVTFYDKNGGIERIEWVR